MMIGWAMIVLGNLAIASLIAMLAWCVGRSGRRARLAHVLWLAFFIKLITPPIVSVPIRVPAAWTSAASSVAFTQPLDVDIHRLFAWAPLDSKRASSDFGETLVDLDESGPAETGPAESATQRTVLLRTSASAVARVPWGTLISTIWLAGSVWMLGRGIVRFARFSRLLSREGRCDEDASEFVRELLAASGSRARSPRVLKLPLRVSPMLFGFGRRPVIICPDQLWQVLTTDQRQTFLAHEAAHFRRRDHWVRWLEWAVTAVYWWCPLVHFGRRQLVRHEEACCDAWAVRQLSGSTRQYAEALLRVVDFVCEYRIAIPRLASGMQPTESLEERLRLLMKPKGADVWSRPTQCSVGAACIVLWLIHPVLSARHSAGLIATRPATLPAVASEAVQPSEAVAESSPAPSEFVLPEAPQGYWNRVPPRRWARFTLMLPGSQLVAEAGGGIKIQLPGHRSLTFAAHELTALVEIPTTRRIVVGDRTGELRLWDLAAGVPVSLIGRHAAAVTSAAYHRDGGLVSSDATGSVVRWDLQSGQMLATWSETTDGIQSVRYSRDGKWLSILTGRWDEPDSVQRVVFLDSHTLQPSHWIPAPHDTAVVVQRPDQTWLAVDWSGVVRLLGTLQPIAAVGKQHVSALLLSQETNFTVLRDLEAQ